MDQKKLNPVGESGTVMLNSLSKKKSKYFPLLFTDINTPHLLCVVVWAQPVSQNHTAARNK